MKIENCKRGSDSASIVQLKLKDMLWCEPSSQWLSLQEAGAEMPPRRPVSKGIPSPKRINPTNILALKSSTRSTQDLETASFLKRYLKCVVHYGLWRQLDTPCWGGRQASFPQARPRLSNDQVVARDDTRQSTRQYNRRPKWRERNKETQAGILTR